MSGIDDIVSKASRTLPRTGLGKTLTAPTLVKGSIAELLASFSTTSKTVTADDIRDAFNDFISHLDHNPAYAEGEIIVYMDSIAPLNVMNLMLCGTLPLDAILFLALNESTPGIFTVNPSKNLDKASMAKSSTISRGAFIAFVVTVVSRGKIPGGSASNSPPLINLLKNQALNGAGVDTEYGLSLLCSSAPLNKFPSHIIFTVDLTRFPQMYYARMMLSPAGTRALRYAEIALEFESADNGASDISKRLASLPIAKVWKNVHPLVYASNPNAFPRATLKLTALILAGLTPKGQMDMVEYIQNSNMESFKKDKAFNIGTRGTLSTLTILNDTAANYSGLNMAKVISFFDPSLSGTMEEVD